MRRKKINVSHLEACCLTCSNCIPIGEGDHICNECSEPVIVISNYAPTEEYLKCGGICFEV